MYRVLRPPGWQSAPSADDPPSSSRHFRGTAMADPKLAAVVAIAGASVLWGACGDGTSPPVPTTVDVTPAQGTITALGGTARFSAQVRDQNGEVLSDAEVTWSSSSPAVATVTTTGLATATGTGTATIRAEADGASGSAQLTVRQDPASVVKVGGDGQTVEAGTAAGSPVEVRVTDSRGNGIAGESVTFSVIAGGGSVSPSTATTGSDGRASAQWTPGTDAGAIHELRATAGSLTTTFTADVVAAAADAVSGVSGDGQSGTAGSLLSSPLVVRVDDAFDNPVSGVAVEWAVTAGGGSLSSTSTTTGSDGEASTEWTLGGTLGTQTAEARAAGLQGSPVVFTADAAASTAPSITSVSPATLEPGVTAVIEGENFGAAPGDNSVTVAGVSVTVDAATTTRLDVTLPAADAFPCLATQDVEVAVTAGGETGTAAHPLQAAPQRDLAVGESLVLLQEADVRCNELSQTGGRYLVSVFNTATAAGAVSAAFELRGAAATAGTAPPLPATRPSAGIASDDARAGGSLPAGLDLRERRKRMEAHVEWLRKDRALLGRMGRAAVAPGPDAAPSRTGPSGAAAAVGDTLTFRIPDTNASNACTSYEEIGGRVVYEGPTAVIVEDTAAPVAGQMDSEWTTRAQEYENDMHSLVVQNYGDPLVFDSQLDDNGRIFMVFSEFVNDLNGPLGFVFSGDFVARSSCESSDFGEVFYGIVPTNSSTDPTQSGSIAEWQRRMRATFIHEVKHISSNANRFANGASSLEVLWLEEATAHIAEELWARQLFGYAQNDNVQYDPNVRCEVNINDASCEGAPLAVFSNFVFLYDYLVENESRTPLGPAPAGSNDATFRGSGWLLTRWAIDHSGSAEDAFLTALNMETTLVGTENIADKVGRPWEAILADWSLANAADDDPNATVSRAELTHPSWDTRDVFSGMNSDFCSSQNFFCQSPPLSPRALSFGDFLESVSGGVPGGTAAVFEISGSQGAKQLLELRASGGGAPPSSLRIAVVRVE